MTVIHIPGLSKSGKPCRRLNFTIGPPGCGKTTLAQQWLDASTGRAVVSLDGLRHALFNGKRAFWDNPTEERRDYVRRVYYQTCWDLRENTDWDIMLPNTNIDPKFWEHARTIFHGWEFVVSIFDDVSLETLLERGARRPHEDNISAECITDYYNRFIAPDAYWRSIG